ncbi:MAG: nitrous oxide-stimulated promoter family protein [Anaerolineae bacterium]
MSARLARETRTIEAMVHLYCRAHHRRRDRTPCPECAELLAYARRRLAHCPFAGGKPTCARCPVHCYRPDMRRRVRAVMSYAGPRMLLRHPILAILHLLDDLRWRRGTRRHR